MADGFREKKMPLLWIDPNGRRLEWSFVPFFFGFSSNADKKAIIKCEQKNAIESGSVCGR
jgi:hypothetical protein